MDFVKYQCTLDGSRFRAGDGLRAALQSGGDLRLGAKLRGDWGSRCQLRSSHSTRSAAPDRQRAPSLDRHARVPGSAARAASRRRRLGSRNRAVGELSEGGRRRAGLAAQSRHRERHRRRGRRAHPLHPDAAQRVRLRSLGLQRRRRAPHPRHRARSSTATTSASQTHGIENLPEGRMLLIGNHAGQIALDAAMIGTACVLGRPSRRASCAAWASTGCRPCRFVSTLMVPHRLASSERRRTASTCSQHGEAVIAFPEGVRGMNKQLQRALPAAAVRLRLHAPGAPDEHADRAGGGRRLRGAGAVDRQPHLARPAARVAGVPDHPHLAVARPARAAARSR